MEPLSRRLRTETQAAHRDAERSELVAQLFEHRITRATYAALLANLHALYAALEGSLAAAYERGEPAVRATRFVALDRAAALARDLAFFTAGGGAAPAVTDATRGYTAHLAQLLGARPALLVAHAYVRYLGDLSGGQMLAAAVRRTFALEGNAGTEFYDFAGTGRSVGALKTRYRAALDALVLAPAEADAIVREAVEAFAWNARVLASLVEGALPSAT